MLHMPVFSILPVLPALPPHLCSLPTCSPAQMTDAEWEEYKSQQDEVQRKR